MSITILGITGPTGAGKSILCEYLSQYGIPVIDADKVYHSLLIPPSQCLNSLRKAFGNGIFRENGALDRSALSEIVFHDEAKLKLLNQTVLGFVLGEVRKQLQRLEEEGYSAAAVDAPTLIESGFHKECHTVISVIAPPEVRLRRIMERDHISEEKAKARIHAQRSDAFYRENSDYVLINTENRDDLEKKLQSLLTQLSLPT